MNVLDLGCGGGDVSLMAASIVGRNGSVVGVDRDPRALATAQQRTKNFDGATPTFIKAELEDLPEQLTGFDAIIGRRVLMYLPSPARTLAQMTGRLFPAGLLVFQELDLTMVPASVVALPLHDQALGWLRRMLIAEGANVAMGFHLHEVLTQAGALVQGVTAEAVVQTPSQPSNLGSMVSGAYSRIVESGTASAEEVDLDTLQDRLNAERIATGATYVGDMMFGAWARLPS